MRFHWVNPVLLISAAVLLPACQTDMLTNRLSDVMKIGDTAVKSASLTDKDVSREAAASIKQMDKQNRVAGANDPYSVRLRKITKPFKTVNGVPLDFKVYLTDDVNAFAMPDGSVRVFSGLMDQMGDDELLFVIGHEIGHVYHGHALEKMRLAHATTAARGSLTFFEGTLGQLAGSQMGGLAEGLINAQFSQAEEKQADDYGAEMLTKTGAPRSAAVTALTKLSNGQRLGPFSQFLSSHPDPLDRAERIEQGIAAN
ncbi:metalloprotease [Skermanella stibiiresistens SB22]|uniref:Metalloprotease n=1 Tax=Skermanella stibiiresistens SB22 TaxID=1385369 RepID=W9H950_9PROT|nr:M48 family metallopeptidase [Skermanella stibiiresistens]EWY41187.1 metalloprotease [Skermanella stibiiresistens SB22]